MTRTLIATAIAALAGCAGLAPIPTALQPQASETLAQIIAAKGVQIYECRAGKAGYEWVFVAPEAELLTSRGRSIGTHGAGPFWQVEDSRVVATVKSRVDAPAPGAIPWLLLSTKQGEASGMFARTSSIQRINTVGGVAPANGCSAAAAGRIERVPYSADYVFFNKR